jgi:hypothetical protein
LRAQSSRGKPRAGTDVRPVPDPGKVGPYDETI